MSQQNKGLQKDGGGVVPREGTDKNSKKTRSKKVRVSPRTARRSAQWGSRKDSGLRAQV